MAADAPAGDGEAELAAVRPVALAGVEIETGGPQPADGEILQRVADREDAQRAARRGRAPSSFGLRVLELQRPLAGVPEPRAAEVVRGGTQPRRSASSAASIRPLTSSANLGRGLKSSIRTASSERHVLAR